MQTITQTQINAYEHCRRFFYLKYVGKLAWPVEIPSRPETRRGSEFHLLVRQLLLGIQREILPADPEDQVMMQWLDRFCKAQPLKDYDQVFAEKEVSALYEQVLWLGKFDALGIREDRLTIFDWKTGTRPPEKQVYLKTPQTRLYRFLAKMCAPRLIGSGLHGLPAENIEMVYWFPEYPGQEIRLPYSEQAFQEDLTWLKTKAREMGSADENAYPQTALSKSCTFCEYHAFCFPETADHPEPEIPEPAEPSDDLFQPMLDFMETDSDTDREAVSY